MISRAHRMGAIRPIYVETLAMRGTVEQQMLKFLQVTLNNFFVFSVFPFTIFVASTFIVYSIKPNQM